MRMFIMAAIAAFFAFSVPAVASQCLPIAVLGAQIQAAGVPMENIFASEDISFLNLYTKALGVPLPDAAQPVGILLVVNGDSVFVGIVENEGGYCVRYNMIIPLGAHNEAFAAASRQA